MLALRRTVPGGTAAHGDEHLQRDLDLARCCYQRTTPSTAGLSPEGRARPLRRFGEPLAERRERWVVSQIEV